MLSPDDVRLVAADAALPGLSTVLDETALAAWASWGWPDLGVREVSLEYVRYKPATNCLAGGTLATALGPVVFTVKAYSPDVQAPLDKAQGWAGRRADRRVALVNRARALVMTTLPYDAKVRILTRLEPHRLPRLLRQMHGRRPYPGGCRLQVVSYRPERRLVARIEHATGAETLRVYSAGELAQRATRLRQWQQHALPHVDGRPLLHPDLPIVSVGWTDGVPFDVGLDVAAPEDATAVGAALAALHGAPPAGLPSLGVGGERCRIVAAAEALVPLLPDTADDLRGLARRLAAAVPASTRVSLCHGDFAARQVIVTRDGPRFVDLDETVAADARVDLGSFLADLDHRVLGGSLTAEQAARIADAFLEGYQSAAPLPDGVDVARAAALLALAPLPFRRRSANWRALTKWVVGVVERRLESCQARPGGARTRGRAAAGPATTAAPGRDAALPWLDRALCVSTAREALASVPALDSRWTLVRATLLRHKPGRRAVIRYELRDGAERLALIGKMHHRGVDRRSAATQRALRNAGFTENHDEGIATPEVVGLVPSLGLWLQREVPGSPATGLLLSPEAPHVAERLADVAVALAQRGPCVRRTWPVTDELSVIQARLAVLAERRPSLGPRLGRVVDGCRDLAGHIDSDALVPAHRDLYPDQVLVSGTHTYVVDLDLYCLAPPGLDAGNCLAHILERALREGSTHPEAAAAFRDRAVARLPRIRASIDPWTTLSLARLVEIADRMAERAVFVEPLLELVERRLQSAGRLRSNPSRAGWPAPTEVRA